MMMKKRKRVTRKEGRKKRKRQEGGDDDFDHKRNRDDGHFLFLLGPHSPCMPPNRAHQCPDERYIITEGEQHKV